MPIDEAQAKKIANTINDLVQESFTTGSLITVDTVVNTTILGKSKAKKIMDALVKSKILCKVNDSYTANPKILANLKAIEEKHGR